MPLTLDAVGEQLEKFYAYWQEELFQLYAGIKQESSLRSIYSSYKNLFSADMLKEVRQLKERIANPEENRRVRHIEKCLVGGYLEFFGSEVLEKLMAYESAAMVNLNGKQISYSQACHELSIEREDAKREEIFHTLQPAITQLNALRKEQLLKVAQISHEIGYRSLTSLFSQLTAIDLPVFLKRCEALGKQLEPTYHKSMEHISSLITGVPFKELAEWDIQYLLRGELFDGYFPLEQLVESFINVTEMIGISLSNRKNLVLDTEQRAGKGAQPAVFPIRIPNQLVLTFSPFGGYLGYHSFYREGGRILFFAHIKESLPFEFRAIGDGTLEEAYTLLFESILGYPKWWELFMQDEIPPFLKEYRAAVKLYVFFDALGSVLGDEYLLGSWDDAEPAKLYASIRSRWRGIPYLENQAYSGCELFRGVWRLRALFFEAQLKAFLEKEFGKGWFASKETAAVLKKIWAAGTTYDAEEIVKKLGFNELDPSFFIKDMEENLRRYLR